MAGGALFPLTGGGALSSHLVEAPSLPSPAAAPSLTWLTGPSLTGGALSPLAGGDLSPLTDDYNYGRVGAAATSEQTGRRSAEMGNEPRFYSPTKDWNGINPFLLLHLPNT